MVGRLVWLVPAVLALRELGPNGVQSAEACSGGVPGAGWDSLEVADAPEATRVEIATDGFVLLEAFKKAEGFSVDDGDLTVRVTDEGGAEVPGELRVLRDELDLDSDVSQIHLGWRAEQPLELGEVLQLTFTVDELGERNVELEVVGEPAALPTPSALLGAWVDVRHGIGDVSSCEAGEGVCGVFAIDVPTDEEHLRGVQVSWQVPELAGMVAWEVRAETSLVRARGQGPVERPVVVGRHVATRAEVSAGLVTFADDTVDHCVVVVVKDLRTGEEVSSEPTCGEPAEPELMKADHGLRDCWEPPTQESVDLWCEGRTNAPEICDGEWTPAQGGAGNDGEAGAGAEEGGRGTEVGPGGRGAVPKPRGGSSGDDGCQFAPSGGAWGSALVALAALLSGVARRRRSTRRD